MQRKLSLLLLLVLWLGGCALLPGNAPPNKEAVTPAPKQTHRAEKRDLSLPSPHVYLIVSRRLAPYTGVADALEQRLSDRVRRYQLPVKPVARSELLQRISSDRRAQVVAIGLNAALFIKPLDNNNQVFCQVFNYTEYGLISEKRKGVSMLPGVQKTLETWKRLSPRLHDIAVISGPGLDEVLQRAVEIAEGQGITLHPVTVANDKEFLYAYKQLADKVQGYWLLPDNRVLSVSALKDVMNFSVRNSKQVVVFNEDLLRLGGLFSASGRYQDIADKVVIRLKESEDREGVPGGDLMPLDAIELKINPVMAQRLGLTIPEKYREYAGDHTAH